jgi:enoyl-CoA hydratase
VKGDPARLSICPPAPPPEPHLPVLCQVIDDKIGPIGLVELHRPERAHAYDQDHLALLEAGFSALAERCRVVLVASTGARAFCAGADQKEMVQANPLSALDLRSQAVFNQIARSPALTIAVVQGPAVGGGFELALACDFRVGGPGARFRLPETSLGILPAAGGTTRLSRLLGPSIARQVILAGRELSAEEALRLGLLTEISQEPREAALALARLLAARDPVALRLARDIIDLAEDPRSFDAERRAQALLYTRRQAAR